MPELGEVDLLATRLNARLREFASPPRLIAGEATHPRFVELWQSCAPSLIDAQLSRVSRKGKYLLFQWQDERGLLLAHLRMTGWWAWQSTPQSLMVAQGYALNRNPRLFLTFRWTNDEGIDQDEQLIYYDDRVLGEILFYPDSDWRKIPALAAQAPDLVATENSVPTGFLQDEEHFLSFVKAQKKRATKRTIRDLLLDQSQQGIGAGLGNYLIAEVLYRAGIHPDRSFVSLSTGTLKKIYQISCQLFLHVIANQAEADATMVIYRRERCPRGHAIKRDVRGNRGSYYCPRCQK